MIKMSKEQIFKIIEQVTKEISYNNEITLFSSLKEKFDDLDVLLIRHYLEEYFKIELDEIDEVYELIELIYSKIKG